MNTTTTLIAAALVALSTAQASAACISADELKSIAITFQTVSTNAAAKACGATYPALSQQASEKIAAFSSATESVFMRDLITSATALTRLYGRDGANEFGRNFHKSAFEMGEQLAESRCEALLAGMEAMTLVATNAEQTDVLLLRTGLAIDRERFAAVLPICED